MSHSKLRIGTQYYWRTLFETQSRPDTRAPDPVWDPQWSLLTPFSQSEVLEALKRMKPSTSQGLSISMLKKLPTAQLVNCFNLLALDGSIPSDLGKG